MNENRDLEQIDDQSPEEVIIYFDDPVPVYAPDPKHPGQFKIVGGYGVEKPNWWAHLRHELGVRIWYWWHYNVLRPLGLWEEEPDYPEDW